MREAAQELDLLLDVVRYAKDDTADDGEIVDFDIRLSPKVKFSKSLRLCVSAGKEKKVSHGGTKSGITLSRLCERFKSEQLIKI